MDIWHRNKYSPTKVKHITKRGWRWLVIAQRSKVLVMNPTLVASSGIYPTQPHVRTQPRCGCIATMDDLNSMFPNAQLPLQLAESFRGLIALATVPTCLRVSAVRHRPWADVARLAPFPCYLLRAAVSFFGGLARIIGGGDTRWRGGSGALCTRVSPGP
jgi:hypothetical protein